MKKLIPILLLCLLLAACAPNTDSEQPNKTQPTSSTGTVEVKPNMQRALTFDTIEEYRQFVEQADLPEDFVYYESLTDFGEFDGLVILSRKTGEYQAESFSKYLYGFVDENGNRISLYVGVTIDYIEHNIEHTSVDSKYWGDMQLGGEFVGPKIASVVRNGVEYVYSSNYLVTIAWEIDGIPFRLNAEDIKVGVFYPKDGPLTIVHDLLHTDTNKAAIERIEAGLKEPTVVK